MVPGRSPRRTRSQSRSRTRSGHRSGSQSRSESRGRGRSFKAKPHVKKVQVQSGRIRKIPKPPPKRWFQLFTQSTARSRRSRGSTTLTTTPIKTARGKSRSRRGGSKPQQQKRGRSRRRIADDDYDDEDDEDEDDEDDIADENNDTGGRGGGRTNSDHDMGDVSPSASNDDNSVPVVDLKKFKKLWETKHRTYNFTLTCEKTNFRVHRHVLCARSTILCRMFKSNFTKDNIGHIMDHRATPVVVGALIEWIYTNKIGGRLKARDLCGLVDLADRYELQDLVDTALSMICTKAKLEIKCVGLILEVTDARDLTKACESNLSAFCKTNLSRLIDEKEFMDNIRSHRIYDTLNESQREVVRKKARSNQAKKLRLDREKERKRKANEASRRRDDDDDDDDEYDEEETDQKRQRVVRINAN